MALPTFQAVSDAAADLPGFAATFGYEMSERVAAQLADDYFTHATSLDLSEQALVSVIESLEAELADPDRRYSSVANLRNFSTVDTLIDFGDGLSIRERDYGWLAEQSDWNEFHFEHFNRDWLDGMGRW